MERVLVRTMAFNPWPKTRAAKLLYKAAISLDSAFRTCPTSRGSVAGIGVRGALELDPDPCSGAKQPIGCAPKIGERVLASLREHGVKRYQEGRDLERHELAKRSV
jgi:hypothetical protein